MATHGGESLGTGVVKTSKAAMRDLTLTMELTARDRVVGKSC